MTTLPDGGHAPVLGEATLGDFQASLRGALLRPGDDGYDVARRVWNGMIDKRPALIARCAGAVDVITAVQFARSHDLQVAVRGGGHNVAGHAVCDDGLVIDLSPMKGIRVDPMARTARAQAGVTWGEFDRETATFGLATTGGLISTTGIAGLTLGGGIGWLMRKYGLACDNLLSVDIITADGQPLTASATENEDLFWGVRGGGGNFGIVTSFEYRLHRVTTVLGGMVFYPAAQARDVLRFFRAYTAAAPDELTCLAVFLTAPPAPFLPAHLHGAPLVAITVCYTGWMDEGEEVVRPLRVFGPPLVDLIRPMPYTALQSMLDASAPSGLQNYWKSRYLSDLGDETVDTLIAHAGGMTSPLSAVHIHQLGGALSHVGEDKTAVSYRDAPYAFNIVSAWLDPQGSERHIAWTRAFAAAMAPHSTGGVYMNFLGDEGEDRIRAAYGAATYDRLVDLKTKYDPTNLFCLNQNIRPRA